MLTIVTVLQGAVGMFSGILSSDSQIIVFERNVSDLFFSSVPSSAVEKIASWSIVQHADPVLFGIVSSSDHPIITCFGITSSDARLRKATWVKGDRTNFAKGGDSVVLGERAAEFLNASLGNSVQIGHGSFRVIGIIKTANGFEDGGVFMPLLSAQIFFHKEDTSSVITIKLHNKDEIPTFKRMVKASFPNLVALEDEEFTRSYSQFKILKATAWAVGGCGLLLGGLGVANTMIMSVFTRIREIAILRVSGFSNTQIAAMIFGESALVAVVGAVIGLLLGTSYPKGALLTERTGERSSRSRWRALRPSKPPRRYNNKTFLLRVGCSGSSDDLQLLFWNRQQPARIDRWRTRRIPDRENSSQTVLNGSRALAGE